MAVNQAGDSEGVPTGQHGDTMTLKDLILQRVSALAPRRVSRRFCVRACDRLDLPCNPTIPEHRRSAHHGRPLWSWPSATTRGRARAELLGFDRDELESEIGVLRSWRLTEGVVDSLALTVEVKKPSGIRGEILEVVAVGDPEWEGKLSLRHEGDGVYSVRVKEPRNPRRTLDPVRAGEVIEIEGYQLRLSPELLADPPENIRINILLRYQAVDDLRDDLDIRRQEIGSRLVDISHTIPDRKMAAEIVNTLVAEYTVYKTQTEQAEAQYTSDRTP